MKKNVLIFVLTLCVGFLQAQEAKFSVEVSNDSILLGNYFTVTFSLENASGTDFEAPDFDGFFIVGGPNQSSSFSMYNGQVSQNLSYTYQLEPKDVGNFYIHPANIKVGDQVMETAPVEIMVVPNPDGVIQRESKPRSFDSDMFFEKTPRPKTPAKPRKKRKIYWL